MKTQFTTGPWRHTKIHVGYYGDDVVGEHMSSMYAYFIRNDNTVLAKTVKEYDSTNDKANAALIAAAPDLYEALHDALIYVTDCIDCSVDKKLAAAAKKHEQKILAALAKARGET